MTITLEDDGDTLLTAPVVDQAALYGLLRKVRDLGMRLLSVNPVEPGPTDVPEDKKVDLLGVGQKSSKYWALNPDTGAPVWTTQAGPGGVAGGWQWGSATDGSRIYVAEANSESKPWILPSGDTVTSGFWSALDAYTGEILWQTADPQSGGAPGAVSGSNGVVFGCSAGGNMNALDSNTGAILWSHNSGNTCYGGAAIVDGAVYWGTGYASFGPPTPGTLFAFMVP